MNITITKTCEHCNKNFQFEKKYILYQEKRRAAGLSSKIAGRFCSRQCYLDFKKNVGYGKFSCTECGSIFDRKLGRNRANKKNSVNKNVIFCSQSCSGTYHNKNKKHGTRVSKLEKYIEKRIQDEFPSLEVHSNRIDTIGYELDFYFPSIGLAIEVNGIFHYQPIFGDDKLDRIQAIDIKKNELCNLTGIKLFTFKDEMRKFTPMEAEKAWITIYSEIKSAYETLAQP